jgi:hypothetical protein
MTAIAEELGLVNVHIKKDSTRSTKRHDGVISVKTFQSQFNNSAIGVTDPSSLQGGFLGWEPENILAHTDKRSYAYIRCNGTSYVAAPVPSTPNGGNVSATGVAQQNVNSYPVQVVIAANGATITNVTVNGITVGTAAGTYTVPAYGSISVAYSVAVPTWIWTNASAASGNSNVYLCSSKSDAQIGTPVGYLLQPGFDVPIVRGTTELYLVAFGPGVAPSVSVLVVNEQG